MRRDYKTVYKIVKTNKKLCVRMPKYHRNANETKNSGQIAHEAEMKVSEIK